MAKKLKLKVQKFRELHAALVALDGSKRVVGKGDEAREVFVSYEFDVQTRWNIRKNIGLARRACEQFDAVVADIRKEVSGGKDAIDTKDPKQLKGFVEKTNAAAAIEDEVGGFLPLSASKLLTGPSGGDNQIPSGILDILEPLLADDMGDAEKPESQTEAAAKKK